ncbi:UbiA prenyltransferase family [Irpex lacteus]|nr:UbiA prenyltransferase family [Irpex lacteus]
MPSVIHLRKALFPTYARILLTRLTWYLHTAILFTWTDYKTIFAPTIMFACATAPFYSSLHLLQGCAWVWSHLLLCNVSNQARSHAEDAINRPWRPFPSGRVTPSQMEILRKATVLLCLCWSTVLGRDMALLTSALVTTTWAYDQLGFARHPIGKNFCNIWGYMVFETAAVKLIGAHRDLDTTSTYAIILSGMVIFTTIQAQDFPDVEGDAAIGRVTFPIYAPEFSRIFTFMATTGWSVCLCWFWGIGPCSTVAVALIGGYVGCRYYIWRDAKTDSQSYILYNCWLALILILPIHARSHLFAL